MGFLREGYIFVEYCGTTRDFRQSTFGYGSLASHLLSKGETDFVRHCSGTVLRDSVKASWGRQTLHSEAPDQVSRQVAVPSIIRRAR